MAQHIPRFCRWLVCLLAMLFVCTGCAASLGPPPNGMAHYRQNSAATYRIDISTEKGYGHGSGTVISSDGYILTVNHVVEHPGSKMSIMLSENGGAPKTYSATVVCTDVINDLAVIKVNRQFLDPSILEEDGMLRPGDEVYNIGYPFDYGEVVSRGHVLRLHYYESDEDMKGVPWSERVYVHDMALGDFLAAPGSSGSGVFLASNGKLVGVMRLLIGRGSVRAGMTVRAFVSVNAIKTFLEMNRIPYAKADGMVATYPPLPKPLPVPPPPPAKKPATQNPAP